MSPVGSPTHDALPRTPPVLAWKIPGLGSTLCLGQTWTIGHPSFHWALGHTCLGVFVLATRLQASWGLSQEVKYTDCLYSPCVLAVSVGSIACPSCKYFIDWFVSQIHPEIFSFCLLQNILLGSFASSRLLQESTEVGSEPSYFKINKLGSREESDSHKAIHLVRGWYQTRTQIFTEQSLDSFHYVVLVLAFAAWNTLAPHLVGGLWYMSQDLAQDTATTPRGFPSCPYLFYLNQHCCFALELNLTLPFTILVFISVSYFIFPGWLCVSWRQRWELHSVLNSQLPSACLFIHSLIHSRFDDPLHFHCEGKMTCTSPCLMSVGKSDSRKQRGSSLSRLAGHIFWVLFKCRPPRLAVYSSHSIFPKFSRNILSSAIQTIKVFRFYDY